MSIPAHDTCNKNKAFFTDIKGGYTYILQTKIILTLILVGISWGLLRCLSTTSNDLCRKNFPYEHWDFIYGSRGWAYDRKPSR